MKRSIAIGLLAVSCVLTTLSVVALWLHLGVLRERAYVDAVSSLADDEAVVAAVTSTVERSVLAEVPAATIGRQYAAAQGRPLPSDPAVAGRLLVERTVQDLADTPLYARQWRRAVAVSSASARAALVGEETDPTDGRVLVDLTPLLRATRAELARAGVTALGRPAPDARAALELADLGGLRNARDFVNALAVGRWALPAAAAVCLVFGLIGTDNRLRALAWWGTAVGASLGVTLLGLWVARHLLAEDQTDAALRGAQVATFDVLTASLRTSLAIGVALGAMLLVAATEIVRSRDDDSHLI